ncbi:hypothetical protein OQA88_8822 [Cercophora sp. LCS_1]
MAASEPVPVDMNLPSGPASPTNSDSSAGNEERPNSPSQSPPGFLFDSPTSVSSYSVSSFGSNDDQPSQAVTSPAIQYHTTTQTSRGARYVFIFGIRPDVMDQDSSAASGVTRGLETKNLYLICACGFPGCSNLVWSSAPDAEIDWPKHPRMDGYDAEEDDCNPETTKYGILLRHCGGLGSWHAREIVIQSRVMMDMVESILSQGYEGVKEFRESLGIDAGTGGWVFQSPFEELTDLFDEILDCAGADGEHSQAAGKLADVLAPILGGAIEMAHFS